MPRFPEAIERLRARYDLKGVAFFHMTSRPEDAHPPGPPPLAPHPHADLVAQLRTDLDLFTEVERDALIYQGYQLADRFVRTYLADLIGAANPAPQSAGLGAADPATGSDAERQALEAGRRRFGRSFAFLPWLKWVALAALLPAVWIFFDGRSLSGVGRSIGAAAEDLVRAPLLVPWLRIPIDDADAAPWLILGFALLASLWWMWPKLEQRIAARITLETSAHRLAGPRGLAFLRSLGLWRRNILWFAGLLPLWLALAGSAVAGVILWVIDPLIRRFGGRR